MSQLYVNKEQLTMLNNRAIRRNSNRTLEPKKLEKLPKFLKEVGFQGDQGEDMVRYPVTYSMPHNDVEMRVCFTTHEAKEMWLDISFKEYENLPQIDLEATNDVQ